ncbi:MAG TPA: DUF3891 family protein [Candidatus Binatia bacterium]|jgi:hypothetical protein
MMVCPYDDSRVLLILQIDHSRIAGLLAAHWGNDRFAKPSPYASMIVAAQEHDSGWWDWEIKPSVSPEGRPIDYIGSIKHLGQGVWLDFYSNGIARLVQRDPYAAFQVSMHGEGLLTRGMGLLPYMPDYTDDPAVRKFIAEQKQVRAKLLVELKKDPSLEDAISDAQVWTNFKLMEVFDQFAQFVCNRYPFNSEARKNGPSNTLSNVPVPTFPGKPDATLALDIQNETDAIVRPYPFDVNPLRIAFQARLVPNRTYSGQEDFLENFYKAERIGVEYTLRAA